MAKSIVDEKLGEWLQDVTIEPTEQFQQWRKSISAMAKALGAPQTLGVVRSALGRIDDSTRVWITDQVRDKDPAFSGHDKDALLSVLACAVTAEVISNTRHEQQLLMSLLVMSGKTIGLAPRISEVTNLASSLLKDLARHFRKRPSAVLSLAKEVTDELDSVEDFPIESPQWQPAADLFASHDRALRLLAERMAETIEELVELTKLQDEELNTLWWSYSGLSITTGQPWSAISPLANRAVLAVHELHGLFQRAPSPLSSRGLLARCFGDESSASVTIADLAQAVLDSRIELPNLPEDTLLPIMTAARQLASVGGEDDTWKKVVDRRFGYDPDLEMPLIEAAEQLVRELDVVEVY